MKKKYKWTLLWYPEIFWFLHDIFIIVSDEIIESYIFAEAWQRLWRLRVELHPMLLHLTAAKVSVCVWTLSNWTHSVLLHTEDGLCILMVNVWVYSVPITPWTSFFLCLAMYTVVNQRVLWALMGQSHGTHCGAKKSFCRDDVRRPRCCIGCLWLWQTTCHNTST